MCATAKKMATDRSARSCIRRLTAVAALVVLLLGLQLRPSYASELDGAWSSDGEACGKIFTRQGGAVTLTQSADFYGSGFVIDGRMIRGKGASCKIKSIKQQGSKYRIHATCATDIMLSDTHFDVALEADGRMIRSFRGMPEMTAVYFRCAL